jgi:hypothetical protein
VFNVLYIPEVARITSSTWKSGASRISKTGIQYTPVEHGDGVMPHFRKPIRPTVLIGAEGSESTHWPSVALSRYRNHMSSGTDIDTGS